MWTWCNSGGAACTWCAAVMPATQARPRGCTCSTQCVTSLPNRNATPVLIPIRLPGHLHTAHRLPPRHPPLFPSSQLLAVAAELRSIFPRLAALPRQVCHADANDDNVLVGLYTRCWSGARCLIHSVCRGVPRGRQRRQHAGGSVNTHAASLLDFTCHRMTGCATVSAFHILAWPLATRLEGFGQRLDLACFASRWLLTGLPQCSITVAPRLQAVRSSHSAFRLCISIVIGASP